MEGNCLVNKVVYKATVTDQDSHVETYTGLTSATFKRRHYGHKHRFKNRDSGGATTLSTHVWELKDEKKTFDIKWNVIDRASDFNPISKKCRLCLKEKYNILCKPSEVTLNAVLQKGGHLRNKTSPSLIVSCVSEKRKLSYFRCYVLAHICDPSKQI